MALGSPELARKREAVVRAHIEAENRHDPAGVVATFHHPGISDCGLNPLHSDAGICGQCSGDSH